MKFKLHIFKKYLKFERNFLAKPYDLANNVKMSTINIYEQDKLRAGLKLHK